MIFYKLDAGHNSSTQDKVIYENETYTYLMDKDLWLKFESYVSNLSIKEFDVHGDLSKMIQVLIPKYGRNVYILALLISSSLPTGHVHVLEDVLDAAVIDNGLVVTAVSKVETKIKESEMYNKLKDRVSGLVIANKELQKENDILKEEVMKLKKENMKYRRKIKELIPFSVKKSTGKWRDSSRLPIMKGYKSFNSFIVPRDDVEQITLDKNIEINIPTNYDKKYIDFLFHNYHFILEFIVLKLPFLIPYIQRYIDIREEDVDE